MVVQTTIRMPEELHQKLKEEAERRGLTLNALLIHVLWKWSRGQVG
ncbi:MAG: toxin-antitoxin system HicB family antitoxin [Clostridiales bacterium]|nr:toxin-antitoxin system HicB family antitoxin [Clostridiales bacterium]